MTFMEASGPATDCLERSSVTLDAQTGKRVWHFQIAHHGLWDHDPPAAPNLIDIRVNGQAVRAVAQVSKQGFVYVFDRVTGRPIWPIMSGSHPFSSKSASVWKSTATCRLSSARRSTSRFADRGERS